MKLSSILDPSLILCNMKSSERDEALKELVDLFVSRKKTGNSDAILEAVLERERVNPFNLEVGGSMNPVPIAIRPAKLRYARELAEALVTGTVP